MHGMDQIPIFVGVHIALLAGIPPIVIVVGELSLVPQFVYAEFFSVGVHAFDHGGGVGGGFEDGVHGDGFVKCDSESFGS
jgi:hypothetical protein